MIFLFFLFVYLPYISSFDIENPSIELIKDNENGDGFVYGIAKNMCIYLRQSDDRAVIWYKITKNAYEIALRIKNLRHVTQFNIFSSKYIGNYSMWPVDEVAWVINNPFRRHISHFLDAYNTIYHAFIKKEIPTIKHLFHLNFNPKIELDWNVGIYKSILDLYNNSIINYYPENYYRNLPLCFDKFYIAISYDYPHFFIPFYNNNKKSFRDLVLKYMKIEEFKEKKRIIIGIIIRKNKRILKDKQIFKYFDKIKVKYDVIDFGDINLKEQIIWMNEHNLIIIIHGASATNLLWCKNPIGIIEITHNGYHGNLMELNIFFGYNYQRFYTRDIIDNYESIFAIKNYKIYNYSDIEIISIKEFIFLFNLIFVRLSYSI